MIKALPILLFLLLVSVSSVGAQTATSSATSSAITSTSTSSAVSTTSAVTSKGGVVSPPQELPQSGSATMTLAIAIIGAISIAVGLYTKYALPLVLEED